MPIQSATGGFYSFDPISLFAPPQYLQNAVFKQVLILSSDSDFVAAISRAARFGVFVPRVAERYEKADLVIYDADSFSTPPEDTLRIVGAPVIVIAKELSSKQWISYFRAGAAEVLRQPVSTIEIRRAIESSIRLDYRKDWFSKAVEWGRKVLHL